MTDTRDGSPYEDSPDDIDIPDWVLALPGPFEESVIADSPDDFPGGIEFPDWVA